LSDRVKGRRFGVGLLPAVLLVGSGCGGGESHLDADLVEIYTGWLVVAPGVLGDVEGEVIGPHFDLEVHAVAVGGSFDEVFEDDPPATGEAAPGHELVLAAIANRRDPDMEPVPDPTREPVVEVVAGEQRTPLETMPEPGTLAFLLVSVPEGGEALLRLEDEGRSQSIDLRTAERTEQVDGFYAEARQDIDTTYTGAGGLPGLDPSSGAPVPIAYELVLPLDEAQRKAWVAHSGYAADGRAWLEVVVGDLAVTPATLEGRRPLETCPLVRTLSPALATNLSFTLTDENGGEIRAEPDLIGKVAETGSVVFDVPAGFTSGTLQVAPGGGPLLSYTTNGGGVFVVPDDNECAWMVPPAEQTIAIDLTEPAD
jgi:hypothetical protein